MLMWYYIRKRVYQLTEFALNMYQPPHDLNYNHEQYQKCKEIIVVLGAEETMRYLW